MCARCRRMQRCSRLCCLCSHGPHLMLFLEAVLGMCCAQAVDELLARMPAEARAVQQAFDEELTSIDDAFAEVRVMGCQPGSPSGHDLRRARMTTSRR